MSNPEDDQRIGHEARDLPAPTERDQIDTTKLRPTEVVPIPPTIILEGAHRNIRETSPQPDGSFREIPSERELLWHELSSLMDTVANSGVNSLNPYEFALYHLLEWMFRTGSVSTVFVLRLFRRRFKQATDAELAEYDRACRFAMRPSEDTAYDLGMLVQLHHESEVAHGHASDGPAGDTTTDKPSTTDPEA